MKPCPPQQQVVRSIGINDITGYFCLQIADSTVEPNFPNGGGAICVEPRYNRIGGAQLASGDHKVAHDSQWHDTQGGALVDLNTSDDSGPDVPREVERTVMHTPDL